jgi:hypothetical protein
MLRLRAFLPPLVTPVGEVDFKAVFEPAGQLGSQVISKDGLLPKLHCFGQQLG